MRLSDAIEQFIKAMLVEDEHHIELKRNELAEYFGCAPSQINYVLSTRFTPDHGYVIESRRGGGGCIRIVRIEHDSGRQLLYAIHERIGDSIDELSATHLIQQLVERQMLALDEGALMRSAVSAQALSLPLTPEMKNALRAKILKAMLLQISQKTRSTNA